MLDVFVSLLKYSFVVALGVEVVIILRALIRLAREKAAETTTPVAPTEN
jgi:hypothetical protein